MEICICGWYFESQLLDVLETVAKQEKHHITYMLHCKRAAQRNDIVNRLRDMHKVYDTFDYVPHSRAGLEFGTYDYYIKNVWHGGNVLFMHDDIRIHDIDIFDVLELRRHDQKLIDHAYIFRDEQEAQNNQRWHGRGVYMSSGMVQHLLAHTCECRQSRPLLDRHHMTFCCRTCHDEYIKKYGTAINLGHAKVATREKEKGRRKCPNCGHAVGDEMWCAIMPGTGVHRGIWYDPYTELITSTPRYGLRHYNEGIYHLAGQMRRLKKHGWNADVKLYYECFEHAKRGKFKSDNKR